MTGSRAYRGEPCMGGQLVYTPDGDVLDKYLHAIERADRYYHTDNPPKDPVSDAGRTRPSILGRFPAVNEVYRSEAIGDLSVLSVRQLPSAPDGAGECERTEHRDAARP